MEKTTEKRKKGNKKVIYVADDDRAIVDAIRFMLEEAGYEVDSAYDDSVIDKVHEKTPHLLLLDIWMSGSDGRDICKQLKGDARTKSVPIIMLSAHPEAGAISTECGANDYLSKPFDVIDLLTKIETNIT